MCVCVVFQETPLAKAKGTCSRFSWARTQGAIRHLPRGSDWFGACGVRGTFLRYPQVSSKSDPDFLRELDSDSREVPNWFPRSVFKFLICSIQTKWCFIAFEQTKRIPFRCFASAPGIHSGTAVSTRSTPVEVPAVTMPKLAIRVRGLALIPAGLRGKGGVCFHVSKGNLKFNSPKSKSDQGNLK